MHTNYTSKFQFQYTPFTYCTVLPPNPYDI